ncbi:MAG: hypothetical protein HUJ97_00465 [Bacteroidales bacterium]|nr:hypothetical protein [Bacteroidales bacterium]
MNKYLSVILFCMVLSIFWCYNHWLPTVMDDELYARIYPEEQILNGHPHCLEPDGLIRDYSDVWTSQVNHYFTKNGRALIHILAQCFLGLWGQTVFDFLNPFVLALFLFLLSKVIIPGSMGQNRLWWMMALGFALVILLPEPTVFYDGIDYSLNYLWAITVCLVFILMSFRDNLNIKIPTWAMCLVAFIAGWSHEGFVIPIGAGMLMFVLLHRFKLSTSHWWIFICFSIGAILLIFSPANFGRAGDDLGNRTSMFLFCRASYILCIGLLWIFVKYVKYRKETLNRLKEEWIYLTMWIIAFVFILLIGVLNERSVIAIDFFAFILLFRLICPTLSKHKWIAPTGAFCLLLGMLYIVPYQYATAKQYQDMHRTLANSKERNCVVAVDRVDVPWWIHRYVCQYHFDELWFDWEERVFRLSYDKNMLLICQTENDMKSLILNDYFVPENKFPGNNPFYLVGDWLYSQETLSDPLPAQFELGDYCSYDITSTLKCIYKAVLPSKSNVQDVDFVIEQFDFQGSKYYRTYLYPHQTRKVEAINLR